jgi:hypothetical protein
MSTLDLHKYILSSILGLTDGTFDCIAVAIGVDI